jgi:hypothetical protein
MRSMGADIFEYSAGVNNSVAVHRIQVLGNYETT